ncbi:MAG: thiamine pyrophosphate-dependent enzyme [Candidatus Neomarinimicrobiota bacterium]
MIEECPVINPEMNELDLVYRRPESLLDVRMHYCPGCGHSTVHKILMEVVDELGIKNDTIGVAPVGCSVLAYEYMDVDMHQAAHGRATAVATGIKRVLPDKYVFTYQGDGDLAAIGTAETIHSANRGENFLIIFINNGIYGMTGGQMAPTTPIGGKTATSPYGRDKVSMGAPIDITGILAGLSGTFYATRQSVHDTKGVRKTKKALTKALTYQKLNKGLCIVEVVSNCPSGWKLTPYEANKWMEENMLTMYPLGDIKVPAKEDLES